MVRPSVREMVIPSATKISQNFFNSYPMCHSLIDPKPILSGANRTFNRNHNFCGHLNYGDQLNPLDKSVCGTLMAHWISWWVLLLKRAPMGNLGCTSINGFGPIWAQKPSFPKCSLSSMFFLFGMSCLLKTAVFVSYTLWCKEWCYRSCLS